LEFELGFRSGSRRANNLRFVVRADEILTAFLEAERAIRQFAASFIVVRLSPLSGIALFVGA